MPDRRGCGSGVRVRGDFVEADLDMAFALLYYAETLMFSGAPAEARRALAEAEAAIADAQQRLAGLEDSETGRLARELVRMRGVIETIRAHFKAA